MHRFARLRRLLFAVLAIVNVGASPLAMAGEAKLVAAGVAQGLHNHIEDHSRPGCAPVHPDECILCSFLAHATSERAPAAQQQFIASPAIEPRRDRFEWPVGAQRARPRTRAPPISV